MDFAKTHYLGKRAFFLFLFRRMKLAVALFLAVALVWFYLEKFPPFYREFVYAGWELGLVLSLTVLGARIIQTYVEYKGYSYRFDKEFFQVNYGYLVKNEIAIVYHHIQNAVVRHDIFDRMIGVSKLVIVMDGSKDAGGSKKDIILPALDRNKARVIQKELMRQARIHSVRAFEEGKEEPKEA